MCVELNPNSYLVNMKKRNLDAPTTKKDLDDFAKRVIAGIRKNLKDARRKKV